MLKIEWKQSAKKDFIAIVEYISQENLLAAETFIEVVETSLELLKAHPKAGKTGRVKKTLEFVVSSNYIIVYQLSADRLIILALLHAKRQWP